MGIACLQLPDSRLREYAAVFRARAAALTAALRARAGWDVEMPKACAQAEGGSLGAGRAPAGRATGRAWRRLWTRRGVPASLTF
jgi:hypothetical protein